MKISVVVTVLNEFETISALLLGLLNQSYQASEIIIIDAGSTDQTLQLIKVFQKKHPRFPLKVVVKEGNRSVGRNFGIKLARNKWIAITDAGCVPHSDWLENLARVALNSRAEVIAGYYEAAPETAFQAAVVPYMLVMPDKIKPANFLPATRSMLIKKEAWKMIGGFDESLVLSEDYDFAHRLKKAKFKFAFAQNALVAWWPIEKLRDFYQTVKGMAEHDARASITRRKAYLIFYRYAIFSFSYWLLGLFVLVVEVSAYLLWAIWKNIQYLDKGWYYLPILQLVSDFGVMIGTIKGKFTR